MITFTDRAREVVLSLLDESGGELEALRIAMRDVGGGLKPHFDLTLVGANERSSDDQEEDVGGFSILVEQSLVNQLDGATVDYVQRLSLQRSPERSFPHVLRLRGSPEPQGLHEPAPQSHPVVDLEISWVHPALGCELQNRSH